MTSPTGLLLSRMMLTRFIQIEDLGNNLDRGRKPCYGTAGIVEQVERSHPVQRDPAEHVKSTLVSVDVILRAVYQGICLPQCRPLFDSSFPEGQGARRGSYDKVHGVPPSQILVKSLVHRRLTGTLTFSFVQNTYKWRECLF